MSTKAWDEHDCLFIRAAGDSTACLTSRGPDTVISDGGRVRVANANIPALVARELGVPLPAADHAKCEAELRDYERTVERLNGEAAKLRAELAEERQEHKATLDMNDSLRAVAEAVRAIAGLRWLGEYHKARNHPDTAAALLKIADALDKTAKDGPSPTIIHTDATPAWDRELEATWTPEFAARYPATYGKVWRYFLLGAFARQWNRAMGAFEVAPVEVSIALDKSAKCPACGKPKE